MVTEFLLAFDGRFVSKLVNAQSTRKSTTSLWLLLDQTPRLVDNFEVSCQISHYECMIFIEND